MTFIQYFSEVESKSLFDSYATLLKDCGIVIPETIKNTKQLFAECKIKNNFSFTKGNLLISWVDQSKKKCSIEIWSDETISREEKLCKKYIKKLVN